jgi:hypothetical protein
MNAIKRSPTKWIMIAMIFFGLAACQKHLKENEDEILSSSNGNHGGDDQTKKYSSKVARDWLNMQLRVIQSTAYPFAGVTSRFMGYIGVALYESVVPGMPSYQSLAGQLNGLGSLPHVVRGKDYHWPTVANAAMAKMIRNLYSATSIANQLSIDSLENALNTQFQGETSSWTFTRSANFGKAIAQAILDWSLTDGTSIVYPVYVPNPAPGSWAPTPPAFLAAVGPYYGNTRTFVSGSLNGSAPAPPAPYSANPSSLYYKRMKEVYDVSQNLLQKDSSQALYYRDNPGYQGGGGHYLSMLYQILQIELPRLDQAAVAYAKTGIALSDAYIGCWKVKYQYETERPIRYIRTELGHPLWNPLFGTPPHPDFPSGHSTLAGAVEIVFSDLFGKHYAFTNHAYDYLGMPPQVYTSFSDMAVQIGRSRVLAGIHTTYACESGRKQGIIIANNILRKLNFKDHRGHNDHWEDDDDD